MSKKELCSRIDLSGLRSKNVQTSVPSINFHFHSSSENITQISDSEDNSSRKLSTTPVEIIETKEQKSFGHRSVSLDSNQEFIDIPSPQSKDESSSFISRIKETFEHKFQEIRSEKNKESKTGSPKVFKSDEDNGQRSPLGIKSKIVKNFDEKKSDKCEDKGLSESLKTKPGLVQEISEFKESLKPKLTELRNRKTNKERPKSSLLTTLLGQEGILPDEVIKDAQKEEAGCEEAVEAQEVIKTINEKPAAIDVASIEYKGESKKRYHWPINSNLCSKVFIIFLISSIVLPFNFLFGIIIGGLGGFFFSIYNSNKLKHHSHQSDRTLYNFRITLPEEHIPYEGWMNELTDPYSPETYHVSQTRSIFVRLQGSVLRIDHPRRKVYKHARASEEICCNSFDRHREYDLRGCEVFLLPNNLPRRWLWSRKYPIFIQIEKPKSASTTFESAQKIDDVTIEKHDDEEKNDLSDEMDSYQEISEDMCQIKALFLFARTDREKDDWFRRFINACEIKESKPQQDITNVESTTENSESITQKSEELDYNMYMADLLHNNKVSSNICWFNAFVGRILYDFLNSHYWAHKIQERIQRKLSKLHLPYFVGEIVVCGVDLGNNIPVLLSAERPIINERGIWSDLTVSYTGNLTLSLETKLDLMKLKERPAPSNPPSPDSSCIKPRIYSRSPSSDCVLPDINYDTDTDDSIESSSESEYEEEANVEPTLRGSSGPASRRLMRIVDSVAGSKYFQQASEWRVLQRAIVGVSNTRIELSVEVRHIEGIVRVNIPPLPSDRLWYGFTKMPELDMTARPRLGERVVNLSFLTDYIEKELRTVFEKVFVLPNMDDIVIPVMSPLIPGQPQPPHPWEFRTSTPKASKTEGDINADLYNL